MKAILGFTRMSVRGLNKVKRELGFVLMALNIRKVVAQRVKIIKIYKRQFLYYFNRNCLFHLSKNFMSRTPFLLLIVVPILFSTIFLLSSLLSCRLYLALHLLGHVLSRYLFRIIVCTFSIFVTRIP